MIFKTFLLTAAAVFATAAGSQAQVMFQIGSQAVANPATNVNVWPSSGGENPGNAIDTPATGTFTKYLNFAETNTGYIFTLTSGSAVVTGINFVTGNDAPERDPASYLLYGSNTAAASITAGTLYNVAADFTQISGGALTLPDGRNTAGGNVAFANTATYNTFLLVFPAVRNATANSMQIGEARLQTAAGPLSNAGIIAGGQLIPEPGSVVLLSGIAVGFLARRRRA